MKCKFCLEELKLDSFKEISGEIAQDIAQNSPGKLFEVVLTCACRWWVTRGRSRVVMMEQHIGQS